MLWVTTWKWGLKYPGHYVERLRSALKRNIKQEYRFAVFSPEEEDEYLTKVPGCFCRLRYFSEAWQEKQGIKPGDRIVCVDLDVVVTGRWIRCLIAMRTLSSFRELTRKIPARTTEVFRC
jgi:hypothetical protein